LRAPGINSGSIGWREARSGILKCAGLRGNQAQANAAHDDSEQTGAKCHMAQIGLNE
jgi:hypothetical protein